MDNLWTTPGQLPGTNAPDSLLERFRTAPGSSDSGRLRTARDGRVESCVHAGTHDRFLGAFFRVFLRDSVRAPDAAAPGRAR
ncbi:hypothetical protein GCM10009549_28880 [Streptomyces thermoalcalitolerans]|uniref:Uncharacterized protein n=1 Tax=Streptomyces thermoalcalitolerans TaxID=65605 RepID=A0ABP3Z5T8_9ACTN